MIEPRAFLASLSTAALGGGVFAADRVDAQSSDAGALLVTAPMAWVPRADGVEILWAVSRLDGLAPGATYEWRAVTEAIDGEAASIPANTAFPYAQMVGGGPRMEQACWIEGRADADGLSIAIRRVDFGETVHHESFPRPV